jgi:2-polyprenyl-3-methyl-5-hydroxy-6-metoxy-1,4-benzoquinol methylase
VKQDEEPCPSCLKRQWVNTIKTTDHFLTKEGFWLLACAGCGLMKTSPFPDSLDHYYKSENYISHKETQIGIINRLYLFVRGINLKLKINFIQKLSKGKSILDYGCGTGGFLKYAYDKGFITTGFEPDQGAREIASIKNRLILDQEGNKKDITRYDIITMWHVLEHIQNPQAVITNLINRLNKDGILIIALPNPYSFDAQYYNSYWAGYDVPRHLYHYGERQIKNLVEQSGLKLIRTRGMVFDAYYVSMLSEKYKKNYTIFGVAFGLVSNMLARLKNKNYSSKIYVFVKNTH